MAGFDTMTGKIPLFTIIIILSFLSNAFPEVRPDSKIQTHHLGILVSTGIGSYREDLVVPISFDGPSFLLGGQYLWQSERTSLQVRFGVSAAFLRNRFSHKAYAAALELRPSWTRLVWSGSPGRQIWCGLAMPLQMRNLLMESWDDAHLYWLTAHSIALVGEYHTLLPRLGNSVIRLDLPVLGFISRPPNYRYAKQEPLNHFSYHFSAPNKSFDLKSIWGYQSPSLQVMVRRGSKGSLMNIGLEFSLAHYAEPKDIWVLNTGILFSYLWKIG